MRPTVRIVIAMSSVLSMVSVVALAPASSAESLSASERKCLQQTVGNKATKAIAARFQAGTDTARDRKAKAQCGRRTLTGLGNAATQVARIVPAFDLNLPEQTAPLGETLNTWLCTEYNQVGAVQSLWAVKDGGPAKLVGKSGAAVATDPKCTAPGIHTWSISWTPTEAGRFETYFCPVPAGGAVLFDSCTKHVTTTVR